MVYITGDIHGGIDIHKLSVRELKKQGIVLKKNDYLIILGDFGLPFLDSEVEQTHGEYKQWIKWLREKPCTILWIDGNHENFNYWGKQAISEWHGGKAQVHPDAPNIIHLMRGEVYDIEGKKYFSFGGAASHDKEYRTINKTWWEQEEASQSDIDNALKNLEKNNYNVDVILSHTPPFHIIQRHFNNRCIPDRTAEFLTKISNDIKYNIWVCGHLHIDTGYPSEKLMFLYDNVENLEDLEKELMEVRNNIEKAKRTSALIS